MKANDDKRREAVDAIEKVLTEWFPHQETPDWPLYHDAADEAAKAYERAMESTCADVST